MKLFAILAILFGIVYAIIIKTATFMFASFVLVLATVGLYDLLIHPFVKRHKVSRRAA